jgi:hypothetical protein
MLTLLNKKFNQPKGVNDGKEKEKSKKENSKKENSKKEN